jgi:hypothetical protein
VTLLTPENDRTKVGVHALLIGVGRYPHLKDGKSKHKFTLAGDIGNLTSPYHSVKALSEWLKTEMNAPGAPLCSLRVLANSPTSGVVESDWASPDIKSIRKAVADWYKDCDQNSGNVALFYFCGHGVVLGNITALLVQDFGKEELTPFVGSFDPAALADAFMAAKATRQLFLIDACRNTPADLLRKFQAPKIAEVLTAQKHSNQGSHRQTELYASELGTKAYGVNNKPSVFMSSLLASMKGAGAHQNEDGEWVVGTTSLKTGLDWLVSREYEKKVQRVTFGKMSNDFDLHAILGMPMVPVTVRTKPIEKLAKFHLQTDCDQSRATPSSKPWHIIVEAGERQFFAGSATNPKQFSHVEHVVPQYRVVSISCGDDQ